MSSNLTTTEIKTAQDPEQIAADGGNTRLKTPTPTADAAESWLRNQELIRQAKEAQAGPKPENTEAEPQAVDVTVSEPGQEQINPLQTERRPPATATVEPEAQTQTPEVQPKAEISPILTSEEARHKLAELHDAGVISNDAFNAIMRDSTDEDLIHRVQRYSKLDSARNVVKEAIQQEPNLSAEDKKEVKKMALEDEGLPQTQQAMEESQDQIKQQVEAEQIHLEKTTKAIEVVTQQLGLQKDTINQESFQKIVDKVTAKMDLKNMSLEEIEQAINGIFDTDPEFKEVCLNTYKEIIFAETYKQKYQQIAQENPQQPAESIKSMAEAYARQVTNKFISGLEGERSPKSKNELWQYAKSLLISQGINSILNFDPISMILKELAGGR